MLSGVGQQFLYHVELVVSWEDNLNAFLLVLTYLAVLRLMYTDTFLFLTGDISLENTKQHTAVKHTLPQVTRCVFPLWGFGITLTTDVTCSVASLVERHEECLFSSQFSGHDCLVEIHTKVCQYTVVELENLFALVAVVHPLMA